VQITDLSKKSVILFKYHIEKRHFFNNYKFIVKKSIKAGKCMIKITIIVNLKKVN